MTSKWRAQIAACDVVLDCTDNVATRDLLNRLCHAQRKPLVSGLPSVWRASSASLPISRNSPVIAA
ncbi:Molybdopterin-synthase adenylyltransferase [Serratia fonticola]|uniref:Molybdopterin-synthase adenylyltransferase n=1 Tax=Serratia fonticola TaxID=47917 RepID=A0A4U9TEU2_SERFO|nr:Molybdopterin-synthase adenylyltransferase [Serratia fonticola]